METAAMWLALLAPYLATVAPVLLLGLVLYLRERKAGKTARDALEAVIPALLETLLDEKKADIETGAWKPGLYKKARSVMEDGGVPQVIRERVIELLEERAPTTPEVKP